MSMCDRQAVDRYAAGSCTPAEMEAIEAHLITCAACEAYLEGLLQGAASQIVIGHQPVPPGVRGRLFKERSRIWRPVWVIALAAVVVSVLLFRPPTLEVTEGASIVKTSGRAIVAGTAVPSGSELKMTRPGSITFGELTVRSSAPINRFSLVKDAGRWRINDPLFPVDLIHRGGRLVYGAQVGSLKLDPAGTRFRVWHDGFEVYASGVVAENAFGTRTTCLAGRRYVAGKLVPIDDDPTRFATDPLNLPSALRSWAKAGTADFEIGPSSEALDQIDRLDQNAASFLPRVALILARDFDADACVQVVSRAVAQSPALEDIGDPEAEELLNFLVGFGDEQNRSLAEGLAHERGWRNWDALVGSNLPKRIASARLNASDAPSPSGRLALVSTAVRAAIRSQVEAGGQGLDAKTLRWSLAEIESLLAESSLTKRGRAAALEVLAEAQYYLPETEIASLDTLRRSVDLWRTPERVAHLCARISEISTPSDRDRSDLVQAFVANPTYRSAERVLTFLRDTSATQSDRGVMLEFARWIGDTYRSVPNAQAVAAEHLMDRSPAEALPYFEQAERLVGGDWSQLDVQHSEAFARVLWSLGDYSLGDRAAVERIARRCGFSEPQEGRSCYRFLLDAGLYDEALVELGRHRMSVVANLSERARILKEAGRNAESAAVYRQLLATDRTSFTGSLEATLSIAELTQGSNPGRAATLAKSVLGQDFAPLQRGWRRHRRYASLYRGRAHWLLGDRRKALDELQTFLDGPASEDTKRPERRRLRQWQETLTPSQTSPRSSENRRTR